MKQSLVAAQDIPGMVSRRLRPDAKAGLPYQRLQSSLLDQSRTDIARLARRASRVHAAPDSR